MPAWNEVFLKSSVKLWSLKSLVSHLIPHPDGLGPGPGYWEGIPLPGAAGARVVRGGYAGHGAGAGGGRVYRGQQHRLRVQHRLLFRLLRLHADKIDAANLKNECLKEWKENLSKKLNLTNFCVGNYFTATTFWFRTTTSHPWLCDIFHQQCQLFWSQVGKIKFKSMFYVFTSQNFFVKYWNCQASRSTSTYIYRLTEAI